MLFNINYFIDGFIGDVDASRDVYLPVRDAVAPRSVKVFCHWKLAYSLRYQGAVQAEFLTQVILSPFPLWRSIIS